MARTKRSEFSIVLVALALPFMAASCTSSTEPAATPGSDTLRAFNSEMPSDPNVYLFQKMWGQSNVQCYEFELESWEGFFGNETLIITVDSGRVARAKVVRSGAYFPDSILHIVPTIDSILEFGVRHYYDPGQLTFVFDPTLGFPYSLVYDSMVDRHSSIGFIVRWLRRRSC